MSFTSSGAPSRPVWYQTLLSIPAHLRTESQVGMVEMMDIVEQYGPILLSKNSAELDIHDPQLIKALGKLVQLIQNDGSICKTLRYIGFLEYEKIKSISELPLQNFCIKILEQDISKTENRPEVLVPLLLAAFVVADSIRYSCLVIAGEVMENALRAPSIEKLLEVMNFKFLGTPLGTKCNQYLKEKVGTDLSIQTLERHLVEQNSSFTCYFYFFRSIITPEDIKHVLVALGKKVEILRPLPEVCGLLPLLGLLDHQFRMVSCCFMEMKLPTSDPVYIEWMNISGLWVKLLEDAVQAAKQAERPDPYVLTATNLLLLQALAHKMSIKGIYSKVEAIIKEIETSINACAPWMPPRWRDEIQEDFEVAAGGACAYRNLASIAAVDTKKKNSVLFAIANQSG